MILETKSYVVQPDITVFEIVGRLSLGSASQSLEWTLQGLVKDGVRKLVVDVKDLAAIDSAGVGILIFVAGQMTEAGGAMRIAGARGSVAKTFEIVHMDKIVPMCADAPSACASLV